MNDFCATLRERRQRVGLSQAKLAERADVCIVTVRKIELGRIKNPHKYTVNAINAAIEEERQKKLRIMTGRETKT